MSDIKFKKIITECVDVAVSQLHGKWTKRECRDLAIAELNRRVASGEVDFWDFAEQILEKRFPDSD